MVVAVAMVVLVLVLVLPRSCWCCRCLVPQNPPCNIGIFIINSVQKPAHPHTHIIPAKAEEAAAATCSLLERSV